MNKVKEEFAAIVLCAGRGSRMKSDIPKQYMDLDGYPVIYYSLMAFEKSEVASVILVAGKDDTDYCQREIVQKYNITKVKAVVPGGSERYDSVFEGLKNAKGADYVLIHDGARPVLSEKIINKSCEAVKKYNACVTAVPAKDTIRVVDEQGFSQSTPDRRFLWLMQTPQTFSYELLWQSYQKLYTDIQSGENVPAITDDAMVVEYATGKKAKMIEGSYENIKITTPEDISVAKTFLKKLKNSVDML